MTRQTTRMFTAALVLAVTTLSSAVRPDADRDAERAEATQQAQAPVADDKTRREG
jgi:hypothetical protein